MYLYTYGSVYIPRLHLSTIGTFCAFLPCTQRGMHGSLHIPSLVSPRVALTKSLYTDSITRNGGMTWESPTEVQALRL
jgi:hypothetical protein